MKVAPDSFDTFTQKCVKFRKLAPKLVIITKENLKKTIWYAVAYLTKIFEILLPIVAYKWPKF